MSKKHASAATLEWMEGFLAEKKLIVARARWWRAPDLSRRHVVVVPMPRS